MTRCYILGAGASHGYDESLPTESRPPLTKEFFTKGHQLDIFTRKAFPDLYDSLEEYLKKPRNGLSDLRCDIEEFLQYLATEFYGITPTRGHNFERCLHLQCALGESFYFIYELFRHYAIHYTPRCDNYTRLARHWHDSNYNVIILNYDILFEAAIQSVSLSYHYLPGSHCPKSIPVAKIHGSINWANPFGGAIAVSCTKKDLFSVITCWIFSNRSYTDPMKFLSFAYVKKTPCRGLLRSGKDYDEPALIPPLADYKDYGKVERYNKIWEFAESMLREASELVIIGCSVRPQDKKLNELLKKTVRPDIAVTVVDRNLCVVEGRLKTILHSAQFKHSFKSFEQYTRTL